MLQCRYCCAAVVVKTGFSNDILWISLFVGWWCYCWRWWRLLFSKMERTKEKGGNLLRKDSREMYKIYGSNGPYCHFTFHMMPTCLFYFLNYFFSFAVQLLCWCCHHFTAYHHFYAVRTTTLLSLLLYYSSFTHSLQSAVKSKLVFLLLFFLLHFSCCCCLHLYIPPSYYAGLTTLFTFIIDTPFCWCLSKALLFTELCDTMRLCIWMVYAESIIIIFRLYIYIFTYIIMIPLPACHHILHIQKWNKSMGRTKTLVASRAYCLASLRS